ncbi:MAG: response regulator [Leptospirales bacterium]
MFDLKILIVEDEKTIRDQFKIILNRMFKTVYEAENGKMGIEIYLAWKPDIVITDIRMPVMDGLEMISEIKNINPSVPIVVVTAYSDQEYLMKAINLNVEKFITKPIDVSILKESLKPIATAILVYRTNKILENQMTMLMQAIMQSNDSIIIVNLDNIITFINQSFCKMFEYDGAKIIGTAFHEIFSHNPVLIDKIQNLKDDGWVGEIKLQTPNQMTFHISISFVYNVNSSPGGYLLIFRDISDHIKLEAELIKSKDISEKNNRLKSEFLATMSHDIRTPMSSILGLTNLLLEEPSAKGINREHLHLIKQSSKDLMFHINDILDVTQIETGNLILEKANFNLRQICTFLEDIHEKRARENHIFYKIEIGKDIQDCFTGDPYRLQQILVNLIGNAFKFTEKGHIIVIVQKVPDSDSIRNLIKFNIIDSGRGIETAKQKLIFKNNTMENSSASREYDEIGLGTSIAKSLVTLMNGEIGFFSPAQTLTHPDGGPGSEFWFTVYLDNPVDEKVRQHKSDTITIVAPSDIESFQNIGIKVLIVEDDAMSRVVCEKILESLKIPFESVENGKEAIKALNQNKYTAVFMGIEMPEMSGMETTLKIRESGNRVPIVAITTQGFYEEIQKFMESGVNRYIIKPVSKKNIVETLLELIKQK